MTINSFRSWLYLIARLLGDVQAINRGPDAILRRIARRAVGSLTARLLGSLFRGWR